MRFLEGMSFTKQKCGFLAETRNFRKEVGDLWLDVWPKRMVFTGELLHGSVMAPTNGGCQSLLAAEIVPSGYVNSLLLKMAQPK